MKGLISDFEGSSIRSVSDIDKIIEPDLFKSTKKIPKYDDYEFD